MVGLLPCFFTMLSWRWLVLRGLEVREGLLAANVISGVLIVFSTESLSVFQQVRFLPLFIFWFLSAGLVCLLLARIPGAWKFSLPGLSLTAIEKALLGMAALIVIVVGFIAWYAPPNTWDSMTYHMARVGYWRQNGGVMNYPTNIPRQLVLFPFAEYVILHLQVLSGGDRLANLVQWSAMACSAVAASLAAGLLGVSIRGQLASALLVLTLPMGILQGSSTQNDYVVALEVITTACFVLKFINSSQRRWIWLAAASFGLAALTKGLGLLFAGIVVLAGAFFAEGGIRRKILVLVAAVAVAGALLTPFVYRLTAINRDVFAAMKAGGNASMDRMGAVETASNALMNAATQLATPWNSLNQVIGGAVSRWQTAAGIDNMDPQITWGSPFQLGYSLDEDYMPNPWHMMLLLMAGVLFWFARGKNRLSWFYATAIFLQAFIFCVTVKWQPWISRFHLPMFIMAMPLAALILERSIPRKVLTGILIAFFLVSLHPLVLNNTRRLVSSKSLFRLSREQNYFRKRFQEYPLLRQIALELKSSTCREVGLDLGEDSWDYTWRVMLGDDFRLEHVGISDVSASFKYPMGEFHPCVVVDMSGAVVTGEAVYNGRPYRKVSGSKDYSEYFLLAR